MIESMNSGTDISKSFRLGDREFTTEEMSILAVAAGMEKKAFRPVVMDLRSQGAFMEFFTILSATNARQVGAIADGIRMFFKTNFGMHPLAMDGVESLTWVLLDYGFFFVHVFQEPTRELYQLEQLWSKGRLLPLSEEVVQSLYAETLSLCSVPQEAE